MDAWSASRSRETRDDGMRGKNPRSWWMWRLKPKVERLHKEERMKITTVYYAIQAEQKTFQTSNLSMIFYSIII